MDRALVLLASEVGFSQTICFAALFVFLFEIICNMVDVFLALFLALGSSDCTLHLRLWSLSALTSILTRVLESDSCAVGTEGSPASHGKCDQSHFFQTLVGCDQ